MKRINKLFKRKSYGFQLKSNDGVIERWFNDQSDCMFSSQDSTIEAIFYKQSGLEYDEAAVFCSNVAAIYKFEFKLLYEEDFKRFKNDRQRTI